MGCAYTGNGGGPKRTEMPTATCPNDAIENVRITALKTAHRMIDRFICIPFPLLTIANAHKKS
jgi:hypothetical protein